MTQNPSDTLPAAARVRWQQRWERLKRLLTPPRQIRPTPAGVVFLVFTLSVGFAALNTGNNLLYLILGMMLSLTAVSGVLSELSMQRTRVQRRFPAEVRVGTPVSVQLVVENRKPRVPGVGLWVVETSVGEYSANPAFFVYIPPGGEETQRSEYRFLRRGPHILTRLKVHTVYPFGLFQRSYVAQVRDEVLVLPQVEPVQPPGGSLDNRFGDVPTSRRGQGDEFFGLRPYSPGDDPRHIHWRSSARRNRLLQREYAAQQRTRVLIKFEVLGPFPDEAAYERGIVRLVSLAAYFLKLDYQVAVELPGEAVPFDEGQVHLRRILRAAALAPRAQEAVERPAMNVPWPPVATIMVRVSGLEVEVEARS